MRVPRSRFFSLSLEARSSEDSLKRLRSLVRSLSSPSEKSCSSKKGGKPTSETVASLLSVTKRRLGLLQNQQFQFGQAFKH